MWSRRSIKVPLFIGLLSGILLGLILKSIEYLTNVGVSTLLLNVDFFPILGSIKWSESAEFFFHVLISIIIAIVFDYLAQRFKFKEHFYQLWLLSFLLCLPTFLLYFLLSSLASKEVPAWNNWIAFMYWSFGHLIYVWIMAFLYKKINIKKE